MADVSIVVPVYGVEQYLRASVQSMRNQTHKNIEIILVDDGSPDRCGEICDELAGEDDRIQVIHQQNGGVGCARNAGMDAASGEYLCFCDPDDLIAPELVEDNYKLAKANDADIVMFGMRIFWRKKGRGKIRESIDLPPLSGVFTYAEYWDNFRKSHLLRGTAVNSLFRRAFLTDGGTRFNAMKNGEDNYFLFDVYSRPFGKIVFNRKPYYIQEKRAGSATGIFNPDRAEQEYAISRRFDRFIEGAPCESERFEDMVEKCYVGGLYKTLENLARAGNSVKSADKTAELKRYLEREKVRESLANVPLAVYDTRGSRMKLLILRTLLLRLRLYRAAVKMAEIHIRMNP